MQHSVEQMVHALRTEGFYISDNALPVVLVERVKQWKDTLNYVKDQKKRALSFTFYVLLEVFRWDQAIHVKFYDVSRAAQEG